MNKQEVMKLQTCVLRVNIHCDGCKQKVKKLLQKIDGVYSTKIDADQGKVTVTGDVDPSVLVKKLCKSGKRAELWNTGGGSGGHKGFPNLNTQFKNLQMDNGKLGNSNKPKGGGSNNNHHHQPKGGGGGGGGGHQVQLGPQQMQQLQQMMMMKGGGGKDMKMMPPPPSKDKKSVKFDMGHHHDDEFDDEDDDDDFDDEFDDLDDDFDEDEDEDGHGGQGHHLPNKMMMPAMGNRPNGSNGPTGPNPMMMMMNGFPMDSKKGGEHGKKAGGFDFPVQMKGMAGKDDGKHGKAGKKGNGKGGEKDGGKKEGKEHKGGGGGGGGCGGLLGFFKKGSKKGGGDKRGGGGKKENKGSLGRGNNGNGSKKGHNDDVGFKNVNIKMKNSNGSHDMDEEFMESGNKAKKGNNNHNGAGGRGLGPPMMGQFGAMGPRMGSQMGPQMGSQMGPQMGSQMGPQMGSQMGPQMGPQMGQHFNPHAPSMAVQGLPMNGGGYFPGAGGHPMNQQQYMQMMMNQQHAAPAAYGGGGGGDMYHPMMYARPYPAVNYAHPPPMPGPHPDSYTHYFSDENTNSCSIM